MVTTVDEFNVYTKLRSKAEAQLQSSAPRIRGDWSLGVDALRLLHRLSSHPDNADDALKLLHELQVHQVELDVQNEEIAANERALAEDLSLYQTLFDAAPFGYFLVNLDGDVIQANFAAAELFDLDRESIEGDPIDTLLRTRSRPQLVGMLAEVVRSGTRDACIVETDGPEGSRHMQFVASLSPERTHILLVVRECVDAE
ncbi:PAS domain-containing protein [Marinimicrobium alkaliphilum]|uniref:PAS domain-containing protein n=1 Tax=Marinimicrobium alkaliphilum TaxID=2202654 RepID=UPI000DB97BC7|nr:PAS domain-containing protein [Marinimicrobium alkaliphilum]